MAEKKQDQTAEEKSQTLQLKDKIEKYQEGIDALKEQGFEDDNPTILNLEGQMQNLQNQIEKAKVQEAYSELDKELREFDPENVFEKMDELGINEVQAKVVCKRNENGEKTFEVQEMKGKRGSSSRGKKMRITVSGETFEGKGTELIYNERLQEVLPQVSDIAEKHRQYRNNETTSNLSVPQALRDLAKENSLQLEED